MPASTLGNQPAPTAASSAGAVGRALGRVDGRDLRAEDVGQDLAPERAGRAAARGADLVGRGHPGRDHEVESVAQPEGDALEHRPRQVAPIVAERQADERAAGQRVRVRAALARQVRQEEQAVAAGGDLGRRRDELVELDARRQRVAEPAQAAGRRQHHRHHVPAPGDRVAEGVDDARCGSYSGRSVAAKTTPEVPSESAIVPGATTPTPTALADWSPPPATTGVPARSPVGGGGLRA